jgi:hypothetical protein
MFSIFVGVVLKESSGCEIWMLELAFFKLKTPPYQLELEIPTGGG